MTRLFPGLRDTFALERLPRPLPGVRPMRTTLRTAHLIAFAALYGGHVYSVPAANLRPALLFTLLTGGALMALEVYRHTSWLVQLRGVATLAKILLVAAVALCWSWRIALLTAAVIVGAVAAHMPGRYRYYSVLHRRVAGAQESG